MPVSGSNGYRSGIVTLPNRVRLREMDSRLGMYPTMARTGDKDRKGNFNVTPFDDRETIVFSNSVQNVMYGSLAISGSAKSLQPYAGANNPNGGLSGEGRIISSISDNTRMTDYKELSSRRNDVENLSFFDDSRVNLQGTSSFYMTGTLESEYSGFSSRLHDKTQIVIDISSNEQTSVGLLNHASETNTRNDTTDAKQKLMAYYNFANKRWETIARGINGNVTSGTFSALSTMAEQAAIGFSCIGQVVTSSLQTFYTSHPDFTASLVPDDALAHYSRPIKTFGFPFHGKFAATGSQTIKMSDYISSPFLIEKMQLQFDEMKFEIGRDATSGLESFTLPYAYFQGNYSRAFNLSFQNHSFFLLRQIKKNETVNNLSINVGRRTIDPILTSSNYSSTIPGNYYLKPRSTAGVDDPADLTLVDTTRELITYSQLTAFISASDNNQGFPSIPFETFQSSPIFRDASIRLDDGTFTSTGDILGATLTSSIKIDAPVRVTPTLPRVTGLKVSSSFTENPGSNGVQTLYLDDTFGSRGSGNLDVSSRALYNGNASLKKGKGFILAGVDGFKTTTEAFESADIDTLDENSPYLLFPEDELILGYQFPLPQNLVTGFLRESDSAFYAKRSRIVFEGPAKLTLFGSQVKGNKEFHDTLNQPLTSEAVHEGLHYDNPVIDQYLIASRGEYSGSYLDNFATGSAGSGVRSLIGSAENVLSGSFQRFVKCNNNKDRYYDTMLPNLLEYCNHLQNNNFGGYPVQGGSFLYATTTSTAIKTYDFHRSFTFDNPRTREYNDTLFMNSVGLFQGAPMTMAQAGAGFQVNAIPEAVDFGTDAGGIPFIKKNTDAKYSIWGFGGGPQGFFANTREMMTFPFQERPRGWKYGIWNAFKETTGVIFRPDRFTGQYADIIQQQYDTRFFDEKTNTLSDPPIKIKFVLPDEEKEVYLVLDENELTQNTFESSNISLYATSSLPYFDDGTAPRNRSYENLANRVIDLIEV